MIKNALLTLEDVRGWEDRLQAIGDEQARLEDERKLIQKKLEAVQFILGEIPGREHATTPKITQESAPLVKRPTRSRSGKPSWASEIERIFDSEKKPLTFEQLKLEVDKGPLNGEFAKSDKGFYHAVSRLQGRDILRKHNGWLFRVGDLEAHLRQVSMGLIDDVSREDAEPTKKSPMAEAIKDFLAANPNGVESKVILAHLVEDPRFSETLTKNATGAYNVISRLAKKGEVEKVEGLVYPPDRNESSAEGSEAKAEETGGLFGFQNPNQGPARQ